MQILPVDLNLLNQNQFTFFNWYQFHVTFSISISNFLEVNISIHTILDLEYKKLMIRYLNKQA